MISFNNLQHPLHKLAFNALKRRQQSLIFIYILNVALAQKVYITIYIISMMLQAASEAINIWLVYFLGVVGITATTASSINLPHSSSSASRYLHIIVRTAQAWSAGTTYIDLMSIIALALVVSAIIGAAAKFASTFCMSNICIRSRNSTFIYAHKKVLNAPYEFIRDYNLGDLSKICTDASVATDSTSQVITGLSKNLILSFAYLYAIIQLSPVATIFVVFIGLVYYTFQRKLLPAISTRSKKLSSLEAKISGAFVEDIYNHRLIRMNSSQAFSSNEMEQLVNESSLIARDSVVYASFVEPLGTLLPILVFALLIAFSAKLGTVLGLGTGIAAVVAFGLALQRLSGCVSGISSSLGIWALYAGARKNLEFVIRLPAADSEQLRFTPFSHQDAIGTELIMQLRSVSYRYNNSTSMALSDINLGINKYSRIAILGPSGSGKSTLLDIMSGLIKPSSGDICLSPDFYNANERPLTDCIGIVSQQTFLVTGSVAKNIQFGNPRQLSDAEIWHYLTQARISEFIRTLPYGLHTDLGAMASKLSGGQRQRLGIARALARSPKLLILDEATSALDRDTEKSIFDNILGIPSLTLVVTAHKLADLRVFDTVYIVQNGIITASGSYDSLFNSMNSSPEMRRLLDYTLSESH